MSQQIKSSLVMQETQVQSQGPEDPLEEEVATHFSILTWRIPWTEKPDSLQSKGSQRVGHDQATEQACIDMGILDENNICLLQWVSQREEKDAGWRGSAEMLKTLVRHSVCFPEGSVM